MSTDSNAAARIEDQIPMKPVWHQILVSIATGNSHGYAIRESVEARTNGAMRLWPATLYGALQRMTEAGLLEERPAPEDPRGKRDFGITPFGRAVLEGETHRLEQLVTLARSAAPVEGAQ